MNIVEALNLAKLGHAFNLKGDDRTYYKVLEGKALPDKMLVVVQLNEHGEWIERGPVFTLEMLTSNEWVEYKYAALNPGAKAPAGYGINDQEPSIYIVTANSSRQFDWCPRPSDVLAEDWYEVADEE